MNPIIFIDESFLNKLFGEGTYERECIVHSIQLF